jgi:hypothetical protein
MMSMEMFMKSFIIVNIMVMMFIMILIDLDPFLMIFVILMILVLIPKIFFVSIFNFQPPISIILDVAKLCNKAQKGILRNPDSLWDALGSDGF